MRFDHHCGFMRRLARDKRGNTIALMAAALVPLMGFAGSAVDFARIYVVKVRLQQACDAGALAGRKAMTDTLLATPLDTPATIQAKTFFANNFPTGWYQHTVVSPFTPSKTSDAGSTVANTVQGEVTVRLPMAVMSFFGIRHRDLSATCQARFDLADTDVMFVLDTTGSMGCVPSAPATCGGATTAYTRGDGTPGYYAAEASGSKMQGLRDAVMLFDQEVRANADPTTKVRYGFVTYSSSVNVGKIIPAQYLQSTTHTYQSRRLSPTVNPTSKTAGDYNWGNPTNADYPGTAETDCVSVRWPPSGFARTGPTWTDQGFEQAAQYTLTWTPANGGTCSMSTQPLRALWRYEPVMLNITGYSAGNSVTVPGRLDGLTSKWRGCIEEVDTTAASSFSLGSLPNDLDPDFKPTNDDNKWRPMWPEVTWLRSNSNGYSELQDHLVTENSINHWEDYTYRPGSTLDQGGFASCGMPAQRLQEMTRQQVSDYVNNVDFKPYGGTYHDAGMIWGARMLSPDGPFAADTAPHPGRNPPSRNIVFMTDGNMAPNIYISGLYGPEVLTKRISGGDAGSQAARHNARFRIACDAAKRKGMVIYVVGFGAGVTVNDDLRYCASPGQSFVASDTPALRTAFQTIAKRVASLRITQ